MGINAGISGALKIHTLNTEYGRANSFITEIEGGLVYVGCSFFPKSSISIFPYFEYAITSGNKNPIPMFGINIRKVVSFKN